MTMLPLEVTLDQMIACVEREVTMRHKVYSGQVDRGKMRASTAEMEIEYMIAVLNLLKSLCPETLQAHRVEIDGVNVTCHDCLAVLPKKEGATVERWKCPYCRLTVDELDAARE